MLRVVCAPVVISYPTPSPPHNLRRLWIIRPDPVLPLYILFCPPSHSHLAGRELNCIPIRFIVVLTVPSP